MTASDVFGTAAWPPAAVAIVTAAAVALVGSAASTVWAVIRWRRDLLRGRRREVWERTTWAVEMACSDDVGRQEVGRRVGTAMYDMQITWPEPDPAVRVMLEMIRTEEDDGAVRGQRGRPTASRGT
jgi:hypothetical protein